MDYEEALAWLYDRQRLGIKLGLDKVRRLLAGLGDPQDGLRIVHVAGTNGKGSVVRMLAAVLGEAGFRVGATTSPHLIRFTERIEVGGRPVDEATVARGLTAVRAAVEGLDAAGEPPTFFECVTALALWTFREAGVEWAVVETGMGGRLDATNVVDPALTVITRIGVEHQAHLGEGLGEIAWEKAGIMKAGVPCVTSARGDALVVLKGRSHELQVPMSIVGEDYVAVPTAGGFALQRPTGTSEHRLALAGLHQTENAALVVAACDALVRQGVFIPERAVQEALRTVEHPGRLERLPYPAAWGQGEVLLDGAHNADAAHALRHHLGHIEWTGFQLVVGFCADKAWKEMLEAWVPLAAHVHAAPLRNPRTLDPTSVPPAVAGTGIPCTVHADAQSALRAAVAAGPHTVVAGSLFLVGEARAILTGAELEEVRGDQ